MKRLLISLIAIGLAGHIRGAEIKIGNDEMEIVWSESGKFSIDGKKSGKRWLKDATLFTTGPAKAVDGDDPMFGPGQAIIVSGEHGDEASLMLVKSNPKMVLIRGKLHNDSGQVRIKDKVDVATLPIDWGLPLDQLKVFGTGGLSEVKKAPGSYMWQAVVDPETRNGVVVGWITSQRGSGTMQPKVVEGKIELTPRIEYGRLKQPADHSETLETLAIGWFDDARRGLEHYADAVAKANQIKLPPQPCGYCTWYHAGASSAQKIAPLAEFAAKELKPFGFSVVQIDDGWQAGEKLNGPRKNFTTHRAGGPYPDGMQPTAAMIGKLGMTPGLWFMPFAGTATDPWFKDHQDWFAKREDGKPFDTKWGGTCLDMTQPGAQEYVRDNVHRITHDWGYKYLKMDGLWTGTATRLQYVNDAYKDDHIGDAVLSNPDKTNIEAYRDGLKLIRKAAGDDVFLLGCCAPQNMRSYGGAFGLLDAMRIGPDNNATPAGLLRGPMYGTRNYFLHGRVWYNDPDPVYVRPSLTLPQAELSVSWAGVSGQLTICSDDLEKLPPERLDLLKRVMPAHRGVARPVDLFDRDLPREWTVTFEYRDLRIVKIVGLFNWDQEPIEIEESAERLGLSPDADYDVYDFWSHRFTRLEHGQKLTWKLASLGKESASSKEPSPDKNASQEAHCCAVLSVRKSAAVPQVISTSRHVTQGLIDLHAEKWYEKEQKLTATSKVVGGDPYEVRIVLPTGSTWKPGETTVAKEDSEAGVKISAAQQPNLVNLKIESPTSRDVNWSVKFEK